MPTRVVKFTAAEEGKALAVASDLLHTPPENIRLKALSGGDFRAQMINAEAQLEIEISSNKMDVQVMGYAPPLGDEAIGRIIERIATGDDVHGHHIRPGHDPRRRGRGKAAV